MVNDWRSLDVADRRVLVGMGDEGGGDELLDQPADAAGSRCACRRSSMHHVALLVELAEDGLEEALGLEIGEELGLVGGSE